jgi:hypothetical protein
MGKPTPSDAQGSEARLYHLDQDIGERNNVAKDHPEVVAKLQALAAGMNARIGGEQPTERRPAGIAKDPTTLYPAERKAKKK